jgi:hypothetical protein
MNSQSNREELARHREPKATAQWAIDLVASLRYKRYLTVTKSGKIRIDRGAIREAAMVSQLNSEKSHLNPEKNGRGRLGTQKAWRFDQAKNVSKR